MLRSPHELEWLRVGDSVGLDGVAAAIAVGLADGGVIGVVSVGQGAVIISLPAPPST